MVVPSPKALHFNPAQKHGLKPLSTIWDELTDADFPARPPSGKFYLFFLVRSIFNILYDQLRQTLRPYPCGVPVIPAKSFTQSLKM